MGIVHLAMKFVVCVDGETPFHPIPEYLASLCGKREAAGIGGS